MLNSGYKIRKKIVDTQYLDNYLKIKKKYKHKNYLHYFIESVKIKNRAFKIVFINNSFLTHAQKKKNATKKPLENLTTPNL